MLFNAASEMKWLSENVKPEEGLENMVLNLFFKVLRWIGIFKNCVGGSID